MSILIAVLGVVVLLVVPPLVVLAMNGLVRIVRSIEEDGRGHRDGHG